MRKIYKIFFIIFVMLGLFFLYFFFVAKAPQQENIAWGINFSQMQAESLKLDWKKAYLSIMDDLGVKNIKLITNWNFVEKERGEYDFADIDWQVRQAEAHNAKLIYTVGLKTGRWPECHPPVWTYYLSKEEQQALALKYLQESITRYKDSKSIIAWQIENEPFFNFGECPPWYYHDGGFVKQEIALVKSLDAAKPVIISDSGEQSLWIKAASTGDIIGVTMYRKVWFHIADGIGFYLKFPLPAATYWRKAQLVHYLFNKEVISIELQAEPWTQQGFINTPLEKQEKTMNVDIFKENISYAKQTGLKGFYLWGAEWWYWLKETQNKPEIWNQARELFK